MFRKFLTDALRHHQEGDLDQAGELYAKALKLRPDNPDVLNLMGVLMTQTGQLDVAINLLERATQQAPDFAPAFVNLGNAYQFAGRLDDAISAFTNAKMVDISLTEAHLNLASALIATGRAQEALESLDIVIKLAPNAAEGYNFKGNALSDLGQLEDAVRTYEQAVAKQDDFFEGWANLGGVLKTLGQKDDALTALDKALSLKPNHIATLSLWVEIMIQTHRAAQAEERIITAISGNSEIAALHHILGVVRKLGGHSNGAVQPLQGAIARDPANAGYHLALGDVFMDLKRWDDAEDILEKARMLAPDRASISAAIAELMFRQNRAPEAVLAMEQALALDSHNVEYMANQGTFLLNAGKETAACEVLDQALKLNPDHTLARNNRAAVLRKLGHMDAAIKDLRHVINTHPDDGASHANLAALFEISGDLNAARKAAERSLDLIPDNAHAHGVMGIVLKALGDFDLARDHLERAIELDPNEVEANWSLGLLQLLQGDFENGWWNYRWRWRLEHRPCPYLDRKLWDGGDLGEETILIHTEQGAGDAIQFLRYVALVAAKGGRVTMSCHAPLVDLFTRSFAAQGLAETIAVIDHDKDVPMTQWHAPLLALPHLFGTTMSTIPKANSVFKTRPTAQRTVLPPHLVNDGPRVGIIWTGNPLQRSNRLRSVPLRVLANMIESSNARFYSLQVGANTEDAALLKTLGTVVDLAPSIHDFSDTADLVEQLDLVISVCTSVAHLSATLGKPTWVMLAHVPDFRWLLDRDDSPWYAHARLFRQSAPGDWNGVVDALAQALVSFAQD